MIAVVRLPAVANLEDDLGVQDNIADLVAYIASQRLCDTSVRQQVLCDTRHRRDGFAAGIIKVWQLSTDLIGLH